MKDVSNRPICCGKPMSIRNRHAGKTKSNPQGRMRYWCSVCFSTKLAPLDSLHRGLEDAAKGNVSKVDIKDL
jgi:hypothetical protein